MRRRELFSCWLFGFVVKLRQVKQNVKKTKNQKNKNKKQNKYISIQQRQQKNITTNAYTNRPYGIYIERDIIYSFKLEFTHSYSTYINSTHSIFFMAIFKKKQNKLT